ncbi:MAG: hydroxyethylthiazole kinase [Akkermansia sp.]|nr:hydroxyethylthiazole kinase [Akkermansia sp.]
MLYTPSETAAIVLQKLRDQHPLVLCLTNSVVQNFTANVLLSIGAAPVMLQHAEECEELLHNSAQALLVNTGTLTELQAEVMLRAVKAAREAGVPWVLDPVAAGVLRFRTDFCHKLVAEAPPTLIRGNASEIMALAGENTAGRGVESTNSSTQAVQAAISLAQNTGAAVLVTGAKDYATDGATTWMLTNGDPIMERVTGMGCSMGALAGACLAVADNALDAGISTAAIMGLVGERAAHKTPHPGSFAPAFLDGLDTLTPADLASFTRYHTLGD